ncbi:hypothetical protein Lal_00013791, partial [Lupinus albus]
KKTLVCRRLRIEASNRAHSTQIRSLHRQLTPRDHHDNWQNGGQRLPRHPPNSQVHPQPSAGPQADGRVSDTLRFLDDAVSRIAFSRYLYLSRCLKLACSLPLFFPARYIAVLHDCTPLDEFIEYRLQKLGIGGHRASTMGIRWDTTIGICHYVLGNSWADRRLRFNSDILHPNRANISKEELREKLGSLYKAQKDQISVFGLRTQFGGGKTTGFALVYDSPEAMKKFEPQYRLVRVGLATKAERASRQQRKQRKNRQKTLRGTAKVKGAKARRRNKRLDDLAWAWACVYPRAGWGAAMAACMRWCVHLRSILVGVGIGIGYRDLLGGTARGYSGLDEEDCFHRRLFSITLA